MNIKLEAVQSKVSGGIEDLSSKVLNSHNIGNKINLKLWCLRLLRT